MHQHEHDEAAAVIEHLRFAVSAVDEDNERLRALLQKLDWKSIDKDNMEYGCRIPYNVMDEIRRALEPKP
jgi:hypothetical protein